MRWTVVAVAGLLAAPLHAQAPLPFTPHVYCNGNYVGACLAMGWTFADATGDPNAYGLPTLFTIYVQNIQGSDPRGGRGPSLLQMDMTFARNNTYPVDVLSVVPYGVNGTNITSYGPVQFGYSPNFDWETESIPFFTWDLFEFANIAGCTPSDGINPSVYAVRTCPKQGLSGWAEFQVVLGIGDVTGLSSAPPAPVTQDDLLLFLPLGCEMNGAASGFRAGDYSPGYQCTVGEYGSTTPEPATLALLAPGVLLVGMARRRVKHFA